MNEIAYAYCPNCDVATNFLARSDVPRPMAWTCLECDREYELVPNFYENPIRLYTENELPDALISKLKTQRTRQLVILLFLLLFLIVYILSKVIVFALQ
jgi:hypothetical protein